MKILQITLFIQSIYYILTGLWPIIHIKSFMSITGPKMEQWLVKTVGWLILVIAITLFSAFYMLQFTLSVMVLGMASTIIFIGIDVYYYQKGIISKIYLMDAGIESLLLLGWLLGIVFSK
jgi:hypothetical protein